MSLLLLLLLSLLSLLLLLLPLLLLSLSLLLLLLLSLLLLLLLLFLSPLLPLLLLMLLMLLLLLLLLPSLLLLPFLMLLLLPCKFFSLFTPLERPCLKLTMSCLERRCDPDPLEDRAFPIRTAASLGQGHRDLVEQAFHDLLLVPRQRLEDGRAALERKLAAADERLHDAHAVLAEHLHAQHVRHRRDEDLACGQLATVDVEPGLRAPRPPRTKLFCFVFCGGPRSVFRETGLEWKLKYYQH